MQTVHLRCKADMDAPQGYAIHPTMGQVAYRVDPVSSDPDFQVAQTIDMMRRYALEDVSDPYLYMDAQASAAPDPITGVWRTVTGRMRFREDEESAEGMPAPENAELAEVLIRPRDVARTAGVYGDCDDFSQYTAALLLANGIPCSFCTIAAEPQEPGRYSHVYTVAYVPMSDGSRLRVPMDTSHGPMFGHGPGWESPVAFRRREWPLVPEAGGGNAGLVAWLSLGLSLWSVWEIIRKGWA